MPADVLLPNSMLDRLMRGKPLGLLSAISGILAGGILGFGTADRFVFAPSLRSCCVVCLVCVALCKIIPNSSAHKLPASTEHVLYGVSFSLFCFGCWFAVGSLFRLHPVVDSGLPNGPRSTFDSPMWDVYSCIRCPRGPVGIAALLCRGQTAGGGSIPRWSASKPQVW